MEQGGRGQRQRATAMARKARRPLGRRLRRNPVARALAGGKYAKRVVERKDRYKRRPTHRKPPESEGDGG
jgi:hypothetical protein